MKLKRRVTVSLSGLGSGSATDSFTEHAIADLRACAGRIDSYRRQGFRLAHVGIRLGTPEFVMENPGPKLLRERLNRQLERKIGEPRWGFYLSIKVSKSLVDAGILTLRDLVVRTEEDLLSGERKVKGLGFHGVGEIRDRLDRENLRLGMVLPPDKKSKKQPQT